MGNSGKLNNSGSANRTSGYGANGKNGYSVSRTNS